MHVAAFLFVVAQTVPPPVARIEIGRDTVRFVVAGDAELRARWGYVRSTGEWIALDRPPGAWRERIPDGSRPVALRGGFSLYGDSKFGSHGIQAPDGQRYPIRAQVDSATAAAIALRRYGYADALLDVDADPFSRSIAAWRHEGDTLWIATAGSIASLLRFDTRTRSFETYAHPLIADAQVDGMATTRNAVWLVPGWGDGRAGVGLVRFDRRTQRWSRLLPGGPGTPDSAVLALDGAGDTLWIATRDALAFYDDARGTWEIRWLSAVPKLVERSEAPRFYDEPVVDTVLGMEWQLRAERDPLEPANRVIIEVARMLAPLSPSDPDRRVRPDSFLAIARTIPPEHFARAYEAVRGWPNAVTDLGLALAHPKLVPMMLRDPAFGWLPGPDEYRALALLGDTRYLAYIRDAGDVSSPDLNRRAVAMWALARLGDTTHLADLRRIATETGWNMGANWIADLLVDVGDTAVIGSMLQSVYEHHRPWPYHWIRSHVTDGHWAGIVEAGAQTPERAFVLLTYFDLYAPDSVRLAAATRPHLARLVRFALAPGAMSDWRAEDRRSITDAAYSIVRATRDTAHIPVLIRSLDVDSAHYRAASAALLLITAAEDVPGAARGTARERQEAQRFWVRWWESRRAAFWQPPAEAGRAAVRAWLRRT